MTYSLSEIIELNEKAGTPLYEHDCRWCLYLGQFENHDLWYHPNDGRTVIARSSSEGSDYSSGMPFAQGSSLLLTECKRRAIEAGYLTVESEIERFQPNLYDERIEAAKMIDVLRRCMWSIVRHPHVYFYVWNYFQQEVVKEFHEEELQEPKSQIVLRFVEELKEWACREMHKEHGAPWPKDEDGVS